MGVSGAYSKTFYEIIILIMDKEAELKKEIKNLEKKLKDREDALPAHSIKPQQMLIIDELETDIKEKKNELAKFKRGNSAFKTG